ncbi:MAG: hypothetical protein L6Q37_04760 [Bdellovibrionaceae bacterium]|nr:hypothetical protein [Pseudobdellovibrionaceae bacterium]
MKNFENKFLIYPKKLRTNLVIIALGLCSVTYSQNHTACLSLYDVSKLSAQERRSMEHIPLTNDYFNRHKSGGLFQAINPQYPLRAEDINAINKLHNGPVLFLSTRDIPGKNFTGKETIMTLSTRSKLPLDPLRLSAESDQLSTKTRSPELIELEKLKLKIEELTRTQPETWKPKLLDFYIAMTIQVRELNSLLYIGKVLGETTDHKEYIENYRKRIAELEGPNIPIDNGLGTLFSRQDSRDITLSTHGANKHFKLTTPEGNDLYGRILGINNFISLPRIPAFNYTQVIAEFIDPKTKRTIVRLLSEVDFLRLTQSSEISRIADRLFETKSIRNKNTNLLLTRYFPPRFPKDYARKQLREIPAKGDPNWSQTDVFTIGGEYNDQLQRDTFKSENKTIAQILKSDAENAFYWAVDVDGRFLFSSGFKKHNIPEDTRLNLLGNNRPLRLGGLLTYENGKLTVTIDSKIYSFVSNDAWRYKEAQEGIKATITSLFQENLQGITVDEVHLETSH